MAIQKDKDTAESKTLKARLKRSFSDAQGRGAADIFKEQFLEKSSWMRREPLMAILGVPAIAAISFVPAIFAGTALTKIGHINYQQDTSYQYDITAGEDETGYVGFAHNNRNFMVTFDDGQFDIFEASTIHPHEVLWWQRDPGDALDRVRALRSAIYAEIESLSSGAENDDISIIAFEQLSPFHQNLGAENFERNFDGSEPPADGLTYAQRLDAALVLLDEAENYIVNSTYGQQDPDVPVQAGLKEAAKIAAIVPALVMLFAYGRVPIGAGVGTAAQIANARRRKNTPKL